MEEERKREEKSFDAHHHPPLGNEKNLLTEGLTQNKIDVFWENVWPVLVEEGWERKEDSEGSAVLLTKKDLDARAGQEGKDYYTRIKDVIDRINQRRTSAEATAADRYRRAMSKPEQPPAPELHPNTYRPVRRRPSSPKPNNSSTPTRESTPKLDLSWKDGRKNFLKKSTQVGERHQVAKIPDAGTYSPSSSPYCELLWDPSDARKKGIVLDDGKDLVSSVPPNVREQALLELARVNYDSESFQSSDAIKNLKPMDGSDWTQEQRDKFHAEVFRLRRDIPAVAKSMDLPVTTCHAYYLGRYKSTWEYRLLKTVCMEERNQKIKTGESVVEDVCAICGDGGNLLICDGCEGEYHMKCVRPALKSVPAGQWECDECINRQLLEARDHLITGTRIFEPISKKKKRSLEDFQNGEQGEVVDVEYQPVPSVLAAATAFATTVGQVFAEKK